jgi:hypothetical protein
MGAESCREAPQGRLSPKVPCIYLIPGIYSFFALNRVAPWSGRKPTFLLPPAVLSFRPA